MKKLITSLVSTGLILAVAFAAPVYAFEEEGRAPGMQEERGEGREEERGERRGKGKGEQMGKIMDEIGLAEEQKAEIKEMHKARKAEGKEIQTKMKEARTQLKAELDKETPDTAAIKNLTTEITALYGQKVESRVEGVLEMKTVLTSEQYAALQEKMKNKKGARKGRRGGKRGDRGEGGREGEKGQCF